jgi:hypothetical protein
MFGANSHITAALRKAAQRARSSRAAHSPGVVSRLRPQKANPSG